MDKIIVITGPTGVGKTRLSVELAKHLDGEIINADSMQIYKHLNIGTAKIKENEKEGIPHHLFDIKELAEDYSIYDYQIDARKTINDIKARGKTVIMVGGTGLYLKSALYDYTFSKETQKRNYDNFSDRELYQELLKIDKNIEIDFKNRRRLIRALDYYYENNKSINSNTDGEKLLYECVFIGLTTSREKLYEIINTRVDKMVEEGLLKEVRRLYDKNIRTKPLINGIGYKELYKYFDNELSLEEAIDLIKQNSRKYAKRQYTWFNNKMNINWILVDFDNFENTINEALNVIKEAS